MQLCSRFVSFTLVESKQRASESRQTRADLPTAPRRQLPHLTLSPSSDGRVHWADDPDTLAAQAGELDKGARRTERRSRRKQGGREREEEQARALF